MWMKARYGPVCRPRGSHAPMAAMCPARTGDTGAGEGIQHVDLSVGSDPSRKEEVLTRIIRITRVVLIAALAATALIPLPRPIAAAGNGTWVKQAPSGRSGTTPQFTEIHCPSTDVCYALDTIRSYDPSSTGAAHVVVEKTIDGGMVWSVQTVDARPTVSGSESDQLACPSVHSCYLLATAVTATFQSRDEILVTANGGQTWRVTYSGIGIELGQVSCPGSTTCDVSVFHDGAILSDTLLVTSDGGQTWNSRTISVTNQPTEAMACPDARDCYISALLKPSMGEPPGRIVATHDGGQTWAVTRAPAGQYSSLACPGPNHCDALLILPQGGGNILVTHDGGRSWITPSIPGLPGGGQIVCANEATCYIFAVEVWRTTDGGGTWGRDAAAGSPGISNASCPIATTCYGVGIQDLVLKTTDGATWREPTPYTLRPLTAIACAGTTCYATGLGGVVLTTSNGGTTWVRRSTGTNADLRSIACPGPRVCLAGGGIFTPPNPTWVLLRTPNGGKTWSVEKDVAAVAVTCPSRTVCYATGAFPTATGSPPISEVFRSSNAGKTWTTQSSLPNGYDFSAIACSTTTACIGVGGVAPCIDEYARHSAGVPERVGALVRPELQNCQESGWLFSTADSGRHWIRQFQRTLPAYSTGDADLLTVACPRRILCYAAGYGLWLQVTFDGRSWKVKLAGATPTDFVQSLACVAPDTCWGIGVQLNGPGGVPVRTANGGKTWSVIAGGVPQPGGLTALTCLTPNRCFAVGPAGLVMAYSR